MAVYGFAPSTRHGAPGTVDSNGDPATSTIVKVHISAGLFNGTFHEAQDIVLNTAGGSQGPTLVTNLVYLDASGNIQVCQSAQAYQIPANSNVATVVTGPVNVSGSVTTSPVYAYGIVSLTDTRNF